MYNLKKKNKWAQEESAQLTSHGARVSNFRNGWKNIRWHWTDSISRHAQRPRWEVAEVTPAGGVSAGGASSADHSGSRAGFSRVRISWKGIYKPRKNLTGLSQVQREDFCLKKNATFSNWHKNQAKWSNLNTVHSSLVQSQARFRIDIFLAYIELLPYIG